MSQFTLVPAYLLTVLPFYPEDKPRGHPVWKTVTATGQGLGPAAQSPAQNQAAVLTTFMPGPLWQTAEPFGPLLKIFFNASNKMRRITKEFHSIQRLLSKY